MLTEAPDTPPVRILIADDEPAARSALGEMLRDEGYEVQTAADGFKALGKLDGWTPDVVITDVKMPALDGIELMRKLQQKDLDIAVIVMTAFGSVEGAVEAMKLGADDYLPKPIHFPQLLIVLDRVLRHRALQREANTLRDALREREREGESDPGIIGQSKPFRDFLELARQVASSPAAILLLGQVGTGKGFTARLLHQWSPRSAGNFVVAHCSALDPATVEAAFFGSVADSGSEEGWIAAANGGTLFLNEVAAIPACFQAKLFHFLQSRSYSPVGATTKETADLRVICSSHRDLERLVASGEFSEDLYYKIKVITLRTPTLRERRDDIPPLASHFLQHYAKAADKRLTGFNERALGVLLNFEWPGNIRQLENCIERAVTLARGPELEPRDLPRELMAQAPLDETMPTIPGASLRELERYAILKTLEHVGGSTSKAAKILGISPRKIQYRLNEYRTTPQSGIPSVISDKGPSAEPRS